jgi:hypothetical protein
MLGMVITRALLMKKNGIEAMNFGNLDQTDFSILPFAFFYFYFYNDSARRRLRQRDNPRSLRAVFGGRIKSIK